MGRQPESTDGQKLAEVLDMLSGKLSHAEACRKYGTGSTYAYKLKDRAPEIPRANIRGLHQVL